MPVRGSALRQRFIRLNKLLSSKLVFSVVTVVVGSVTMSLFAILVGLAAHYNRIEATKQRDIVVMTQAIVFAVMLLLISAAIVIALIIDIVLSSLRESKAKVMSKDEKYGNEKFHVHRTKRFGFIQSYFKNDPLMFRAEIAIIVLSIIVIIALYSIGIVSVVRQPRTNHPIMISRTALELLFLFVRIVAFGGFALLVTVQWIISAKGTTAHSPPTTDYEKMNSASTSSSSQSITSKEESKHDQKILNILRHEQGYQLVFNYCMLEFSLENILLWKDLESTRSRNLLMTTEERRQILRELKELYIDANSERQLNMSNRQKKLFMSVANSSEPSAMDAESVFAQLHGICLSNIGDTMSRFWTTEGYKSFEETMRMSVELREDFESKAN